MEDQAIYGTVTVRRSIYRAAQALTGKAEGSNWSDIHLAEWNRDRCRDEGDEAGRAFWHEVWDHMMEMYCAADADTVVEVTEDGGPVFDPQFPAEFRRHIRRRPSDTSPR